MVKPWSFALCFLYICKYFLGFNYFPLVHINNSGWFFDNSLSTSDSYVDFSHAIFSLDVVLELHEASTECWSYVVTRAASAVPGWRHLLTLLLQHCIVFSYLVRCQMDTMRRRGSSKKFMIIQDYTRSCQENQNAKHWAINDKKNLLDSIHFKLTFLN